jgi:hypothetical protein
MRGIFRASARLHPIWWWFDRKALAIMRRKAARQI